MIVLNVGCGEVSDAEAINVDAAETAAAQVRGDLRALPFLDGCAREVRMSQVLEHLPRRMVPSALAEALRVLQPAGLLRVSVPDFGAMCRTYGDAPLPERLAYYQATIFGAQRYPTDAHLVGFDRELLAHALTTAGLEDVQVESEPNRAVWEACLAATGKKPA